MYGVAHQGEQQVLYQAILYVRGLIMNYCSAAMGKGVNQEAIYDSEGWKSQGYIVPILKCHHNVLLRLLLRADFRTLGR